MGGAERTRVSSGTPWEALAGYSRAVRVGDAVWVSGTTASDEHGNLRGGDTAYTEAFAALRGRGPVDLAILPIGAYDPWITSHASPEEAWRMFQALGAEYLLPIHHSTFRLSREPMDEPVRRLLAVAGAERDRVIITEVGQSWSRPPGDSSAVA